MNDKITIHPKNGYVLIRPDEVKHPLGIEIPDRFKQEPKTGIVVRSDAKEVSIGDRVEWKELSGHYIGEYLLVYIEDILYKVPNGTDVS